MRVLVACEFSGVVRRAFRARGHEAYSCDILPALDRSPYHIWKDVTPVLKEEWDLVIAHPPCTYLCNSGVCWMRDVERRIKCLAGCEFFKMCLNANAVRVCVENPIMHGYAKERIGVDYTQIVHPWQYGHGQCKSTCLWLKNLPPLHPVNVVEGRGQAIHYLNGKNRGLKRSITFEGIASAMASQWGGEETMGEGMRHA